MQKTERFVSRPDAQLYTQATGQADQGTILLAMGATASMVWWPDAFVEALATAGYRVIAFDHRDTGRSTLSPIGAPAYDVPELAQDVVAILDAYDVSAAHLVGMSLGGLIAQVVALTQPARVASLTLFAAEPLGHDYEGAGMPDEIMAHFGGLASLDWTDRDAVTAFLLRIAELSAAPARPFDRTAALDRIARELDHTPNMQAAFNQALLAGAIDPALQARNITQPTLVIHGAADPLIPIAAARKTSALIPHAELIVLDNVGHELMPADVRALSKAVIGFVGKAGV